MESQSAKNLEKKKKTDNRNRILESYIFPVSKFLSIPSHKIEYTLQS